MKKWGIIMDLVPVYDYKKADVVMVTLNKEDFANLVLGKPVYVGDEDNDLIIMITKEV